MTARPMPGISSMPPGNGPFPAVICIHGGVSKAGDQTLKGQLTRNPAYTQLLAAGFVTVAGDFRSYGQDLKSRGPIYDCLATFKAVQALEFVDEKSVAIYGGSRGGSLALELAADAKPGAIVCGESASLLFMGILDRFKVLEDPKAHYTDDRKAQTQKKIDRFSCPVLILDGDVHPLKTLNREYLLPQLQKAKVPVTYIIYPGNPHGFYWGNGATKQTLNDIMNEVKAFLSTQLISKPTPIEKTETQNQTTPPSQPVKKQFLAGSSSLKSE